jgi:hypothetical protein
MTRLLPARLASFVARSARARQGEVLGAGVVMQCAFGVHRHRISCRYCRPFPFVAQHSLNRWFLVIDGESLQHAEEVPFGNVVPWFTEAESLGSTTIIDNPPFAFRATDWLPREAPGAAGKAVEV